MEKEQVKRSRQIRLAFQQKDRKVRESRENFISDKKRKIEGGLHQWQHVVSENRQKHLTYLDGSDHVIRQWNDKCENSMNKKKERLNTISSGLSERSRISSAKTIKHQEKEMEKMLEKALVKDNGRGSNEKLESRQNKSRTMHHHHHETIGHNPRSRMITNKNCHTMNSRVSVSASSRISTETATNPLSKPT